MRPAWNPRRWRRWRCSDPVILRIKCIRVRVDVIAHAPPRLWIRATRANDEIHRERFVIRQQIQDGVLTVPVHLCLSRSLLQVLEVGIEAV